MALFQKTVITKYLQTQNKENLIEKWDLFRAHFHNPIIQKNIRNSKEEQYQEGFLRDLFVSIFGYQLNPAHNFNLTTEYKNVKDSKKADGAIIIDEVVTAIIELKRMNITDLSKVEDQAFGYKNNQENCKYVITSNFEKLRFYVDNAIEHIEFNLFELTQEQFNLMYLILAFENIKKNIPKKLKDESLNQEDIVTKKLYKDYSVFKRELFQNLILLNPDYDPLLLFQKSQKLLDRLLFLFFGEDRGLLPPNSVRQILAQWNKLQDLDEYVPLYNRYKKYFGYLNTGFKGKNHDVFAYNGGLFKEDEVLDNITIDDQLLYDHTFRLSQYDFASEVDVNILGHIFENSLNEIDEIKAQLEGQEIDKSKSKRKKDGVFYTPKYITKYIVENTVGKLCEEKKGELGIIEEEYFTDKKRQQKTSKNLLDKLDHYRDWLLQLTIVDPACGSGAFLNEALNFLIKEHQYIDELEAKLRNVPIIFSYHSESILEHNLFGVDLNEESVEIAKLSLWLRTAEPNRKLNSLNDNIKCGNSLIDDPEVAGEKAFKWEEEFPQVFAKGGFDVVIGNPPYGIFMSDIEKAYYINHFPLTSYKINLYILFIERMLQILDKGIIHFIIPKSLLFNTFYKTIREELLHYVQINEIHTITEEVFEDADVGSSLLLNFEIKQEIDLNKAFRLAESEKISNFITNSKITESYQSQQFFLTIPNFEISIINQDKEVILLKLLKLDVIKDFYKLKNGLNPGNIKHILISDAKDTLNHKQIIWGKDINKYTINWSGDFINYDENLIDTIKVEDIKSKQGMKSQTKIDFALRNPELFESEKIVVRKTGDKLIASLDLKKYYFDTLVHGIYKLDHGPSLKSLLAILNSKPATLFYRLLHDIKGKVFAKISLDNLACFPLPIISNEQDLVLSEKADLMLSQIKDLQEISAKFLRTCERKFDNLNLNKKLQDWYNLSYADFIEELSKQKIKLTLSEEAEWADYFDQEKSKALEIQSQITA
ncbi:MULTISPECIES: TaqI-like C-terminal specificity domain-containing protein, partial [unclassified Kaistella]|uniref:Eco57I restriction-modification methylase domain-containing protein n=1 Tax=unclassified Kaistella TaxID=2762626 RepID=UPI0027360427